MNFDRFLLGAATCALPTLMLVGCSGGSSGSSSPTGDFLLGDAPADDLLSFEATATSLRLRNDGGIFTGNLLEGPVRLEFLGLNGISAWIASANFPADTYDAAEVVFDSTSVDAAAKDGTPVTVTVLSDTLVADFPSASAVSTGYQRFEIDLDLLASIGGDVVSGTITFDPSGSAALGDDSMDEPIDEIEGILKSFDVTAGTFVVSGYSDGDTTLDLGDVTVAVDANTIFFNDDGTSFADSTAFFAALVNGTTLLEIDGDLGTAGTVNATRVEIEDGTGSGSNTLVKIEGLILDITPGVDFELLIREIEKGESIADTVLSGLGDPVSITVSFDMATVFLTDDGDLADSTGLVTGQEVKVKFAEFSTSPFPGFQIEIEDIEPEMEAIVTGVTGLPDAIEVNLDDDDPSVTTGAVDSGSTTVSVDLTMSTLALDSEGHPTLTAEDLVTGLELDIRGVLFGLSASPTIAASSVDVKPGRIEDATVTTSDSTAGTFNTSSGTIVDPFGGAATAGPFTVTIESACVFTGDATTAAEFHAAVAALGAADAMFVEIKGLGTAVAGELRAFEVDVMIVSEL